MGKVLDRLAQKCEAMEAETGECSVENAAGECRAMLGAFTKARDQALELVDEANVWMKNRSLVRDDGKTVTISFNLSGLPGYPFKRADAITNNALDISNSCLSAVAEKIGALKKQKSCRRRKAAIESMDRIWEGEGPDAIASFHNLLGEAISGYLLEAQRALEAGKLEEAQEALEKNLR